MQTNTNTPAPAGAPGSLIVGTQLTRSFRLHVHADRLPNSHHLDHGATVAFARWAADRPSKLVMYGDASASNPWAGAPKTGVAVAWKRRDEPLHHVVGRTMYKGQPMHAAQGELWAVKACLGAAHAERWAGVEQEVVVLTDSIVAMQHIKDWVPGHGGPNEEVMRRIKLYDELFAAQGVRVVVRYLKGRQYVDGHDTADVMARQLANGPRVSPWSEKVTPRWSGRADYREREEYIYRRIQFWCDALVNSAEVEEEWNKFEAEMA